MFLALAGGVGGAKLARGLAAVLGADELVVAVNTGDDFEHLGLHVSPDLDTVMYTLAGINDEDSGWGLAGETWQFMEALARLGGETWFRLGDRDLATHVERTRRLTAGESLSAVTRDLAARLGVRHGIVPMSDDAVRTIVETDSGRLSFQDYFVRHRAAPRLSAVAFAGADQARPSPAFAAALASEALEAVIVCPSNPVLSILPILAVAGVRKGLAALRAPVVAVSPIVGGRAIRGPAVAVMRALGHEASAAGVAAFYRDLPLAGLVIDSVDGAAGAGIEASGNRVLVTDTVMRDAAMSAALAREVIAFARALRR